jgi:hypothetical protein
VSFPFVLQFWFSNSPGDVVACACMVFARMCDHTPPAWARRFKPAERAIPLHDDASAWMLYGWPCVITPSIDRGVTGTSSECCHHRHQRRLSRPACWVSLLRLHGTTIAARLSCRDTGCTGDAVARSPRSPPKSHCRMLGYLRKLTSFFHYRWRTSSKPAT